MPIPAGATEVHGITDELDALGDIKATKEVMQWLVDNAAADIGDMPQQWAEYSGGCMNDPFWFTL